MSFDRNGLAWYSLTTVASTGYPIDDIKSDRSVEFQSVRKINKKMKKPHKNH
jgi:hypothetical protein